MRAALAVLLAVVVASTAHAEDPVQPVPAQQAHSRQLMQADGSYGYGSYGSYEYGYEGGYGGARRRLIEMDGGYGGYYGYGYGGYYGRKLSELLLEPVDPLLEYAEEVHHEQQQQPEEQQGQVDEGLSAAASAALHQAQSRSASNSWAVPAGQCYCRYDTDYNTWALAEDSCKQALYQRCKTGAGLPCQWLDKFYAPAHGPAHTLPHESEIAGFLYEDCSPQPPCACGGLKFDGSDAVPVSVACCKDLKVACRTPFSGLCCKKVAEFCSDDKPQPLLAAWTGHALHRADCSAYQGTPYQFVPLEEMKAAMNAVQQRQQQQAQAAKPTTEAELLQQALASLEQQQTAAAAAPASNPASQSATVFMAAAAAGALCVAVVAVLFAMKQEHHFVEDDDEEDDVQSGGLNPHTSLGMCPAPASYCDMGTGDPTLSRVVSVGALSSASSVREPLLPTNVQGMNRVVSTGSSMLSMSGEVLPPCSSQASLEHMS